MKIMIDLVLMAKDTENMSEEGKGSCLLRNLRKAYAGDKDIVPWLEPMKKKPKACPKDYTELFEVFWSEWPASPRKTSKRSAFKSWWKMADGDEELMLKLCIGTLKWLRKTEQWMEEKGKYIPMPSTWLNQERFLDENPEPDKDPDQKVLCSDGVWR